MIELYDSPLTNDQLLRLECLTLAVDFHKGNPNMTMTSGQRHQVYRTAEEFVRYVKEPR